MTEEEHEAMHRQGELAKFTLLVFALVFVVLGVAAARPLIFGYMIPAALGWNTEPAPPELPAGAEPSATPEFTPAGAEPENPNVDATPKATEPATEVEATATPRLHTVQPGENLTRIAGQYGVTVEAIIQANNITNPNRIRPGDVLVIP